MKSDLMFWFGVLACVVIRSFQGKQRKKKKKKSYQNVLDLLTGHLIRFTHTLPCTDCEVKQEQLWLFAYTCPNAHIYSNTAQEIDLQTLNIYRAKRNKFEIKWRERGTHAIK